MLIVEAIHIVSHILATRHSPPPNLCILQNVLEIECFVYYPWSLRWLVLHMTCDDLFIVITHPTMSKHSLPLQCGWVFWSSSLVYPKLLTSPFNRNNHCQTLLSHLVFFFLLPLFIIATISIIFVYILSFWAHFSSLLTYIISLSASFFLSMCSSFNWMFILNRSYKGKCKQYDGIY